MRKVQVSKRNYIVDGSSALDARYVTYEKVAGRKAYKRKQARRKQAKFDYAKTIAVFILTIIVMSIILLTLKSQFAVNDKNQEIILLKKELADIRMDNMLLAAKIEKEIDIVKIKDIALNEYGMVYPTKDDVIKLGLEDSSYTVVYDNIESVDKNTTSIPNVVAFITRGW